MEKFVKDEIPADVKKLILQLVKERGCSDTLYRELGSRHSISDLFRYLQDNFFEITRENVYDKKINKAKDSAQQLLGKTMKGLEDGKFTQPQVDYLIMQIDEDYPELLQEYTLRNHSEHILEVLKYPKSLIPENIDEESKLELIADSFRNYNWFQLKEKLSA